MAGAHAHLPSAESTSSRPWARAAEMALAALEPPRPPADKQAYCTLQSAINKVGFRTPRLEWPLTAMSAVLTCHEVSAVCLALPVVSVEPGFVPTVCSSVRQRMTAPRWFTLRGLCPTTRARPCSMSRTHCKATHDKIAKVDCTMKHTALCVLSNVVPGLVKRAQSHDTATACSPVHWVPPGSRGT